jgi:hypothetical protein
MRAARRGPRPAHCAAATWRFGAEALIFPAGVTWRAVSSERWRLAGSDDQDTQFSVACGRRNLARAAVGQHGGDRRARGVAQWSPCLGRPAQPGGAGLEQPRRRRGRPVLLALTVRPADPAATGLNGARQRAVAEAVLAGQGGALAAEATSASLPAPRAPVRSP